MQNQKNLFFLIMRIVITLWRSCECITSNKRYNWTTDENECL